VALIAAAPGRVLLLKVRAHKGILGNEGADGGAVWAAQATAGHDVTATEPRDALTGLAAVSEVQADGSYRPIRNIGPALKKMMQARHRMGAAKHSDYHTYYQALHSPKPVAEGDPDDPGDRAVQGPLAWLMRGSKTREATVLMQIRTGNVYNQKHAHRWGWSPDACCPLCGMADSTTHILSACQHKPMNNMVAERHNQAGRLIAAAVDESGKGGGLVFTDVGRAEHMAAAGLEHLPNMKRAIPTWLVAPTLQHLLGGVGSIPDAILVEHTDPTAPECTPDSIPIGSRRVTLIEIKFCPDTLPGAQLERARTQHKALSDLLTSSGSTVRVLPILLGIGGTMYQRHTQQALWDLGIPHTRTTRLLHELSQLAIQKAVALIGMRRVEAAKRGGRG
jgi:hypothetical protein